MTAPIKIHGGSTAEEALAVGFFEAVDLLEPDPEVEQPSRRFFGTPVVGFHFVRLIE